MKKIIVIICFFLGVIAAQAQHTVNPFFDEKGIARIQTHEFSDHPDTIISIFHRQDDIIWSRVVYRIIDMRYKQNFQLYFPTRYDDPTYRNLFKVIVDAIVDGMPVYQKAQDQIKPIWEAPMKKTDIPTMFLADDPLADYSNDLNHYDIATSDAMVLNYDSVTDKLKMNFYPFESFVRNQLKYLIQEIVFFDRHTSRMHSKIMAIAPMNSDKITTRDSTKVSDSMLQSMLFWISFDDLRPYLAKQYIIPSQNETKRVTFDEFFAKHLYTSYIVGEGNMYNRMIPDYAYTNEEIKKEQDRIATELLNFEQDLWEY